MSLWSWFMTAFDLPITDQETISSLIIDIQYDMFVKLYERIDLFHLLKQVSVWREKAVWIVENIILKCNCYYYKNVFDMLTLYFNFLNIPNKV